MCTNHVLSWLVVFSRNSTVESPKMKLSPKTDFRGQVFQILVYRCIGLFFKGQFCASDSLKLTSRADNRDFGL